jgi:hypothetical protein
MTFGESVVYRMNFARRRALVTSFYAGRIGIHKSGEMNDRLDGRPRQIALAIALPRHARIAVTIDHFNLALLRRCTLRGGTTWSPERGAEFIKERPNGLNGVLFRARQHRAKQIESSSGIGHPLR